MSNLMKTLTIGSSTYEVCDAFAREALAEFSTAVSSHNEDASAHADIREQINLLSGGNASGLTVAQISALDGMFKIASFTVDPTGAYAAFKTAFGITDSGEIEPDDPVKPDESGIIYELSEPMTFDGTNYVDTGLKLCAENKDVTIELEYTGAANNSNDAGVLHCTVESSPWHGIAYGIGSGNYTAGSSIGLTKTDTETRRIVIVKDSVNGTIITYCSNGNTVEKANTSNRNTMTHEQSMWLGAKQATNGGVYNNSYWKGTISHLRIYNRQLNDNEINEFLEVETDSEEVSLNSISATYNGGNVVVGTAVTTLNGIVVTAHYSDGTSKPVTGYTLSGTIAEGSNTVTVSYGSKTTTIIVIGIAASGGQEPPEEEGVLYALSEPMTFAGTNYFDTGVKLCAENIDLTIELEYTPATGNGSTAGVLHCTMESNPYPGVSYGITQGNYAAGSSIGLTNADTETRRIVMVKDATAGTLTTYCSNGNTTVKDNTNNRITMTFDQTMWLGAKQNTSGGAYGGSYWKGTISHLKVYGSQLSADKINEFLGVEVA